MPPINIGVTFNGKHYRSPDDMPPEVREKYEQVMKLFADNNNDGTPDILDGTPGASFISGVIKSVTANLEQKFIVDGQEHSSIGDLPQPARRTLEQSQTSTSRPDSAPNRSIHQDPALLKKSDGLIFGANRLMLAIAVGTVLALIFFSFR
jgi:hypothetical protein